MNIYAFAGLTMAAAFLGSLLGAWFTIRVFFAHFELLESVRRRETLQ